MPHPDTVRSLSISLSVKVSGSEEEDGEKEEEEKERDKKRGGVGGGRGRGGGPGGAKAGGGKSSAGGKQRGRQQNGPSNLFQKAVNSILPLPQSQNQSPPDMNHRSLAPHSSSLPEDDHQTFATRRHPRCEEEGVDGKEPSAHPLLSLHKDREREEDERKEERENGYLRTTEENVVVNGLNRLSLSDESPNKNHQGVSI